MYKMYQTEVTSYANDLWQSIMERTLPQQHVQLLGQFVIVTETINGFVMSEAILIQVLEGTVYYHDYHVSR